MSDFAQIIKKVTRIFDSKKIAQIEESLQPEWEKFQFDLEDLSTKIWVSPDGTKARAYIAKSRLQELYGLKYEPGPRGFVRWATLDGETISNCRGNNLIASLSQQKLWIDFGDGEIDGFGDLTGALSSSEGAEKVQKVVEEFRQKIISAATNDQKNKMLDDMKNLGIA